MTTLTGSKHAYLEIKELLLDWILDNNIKVGERLPTITEIAERLDVSRPTVIRAVNELAKEGTVLSQRRRGIVVKSIPEPFSGVKSRSIVVLSRPGDQIDENTAQMSQFFPERQFVFMSIDEEMSDGFSQEFMDQFISDYPSDMYLLRSVSSKVKQYFQNKTLPCIIMGGLGEGIHLPNICEDQYTRSYQAVRYLIEDGYENICLLENARKAPGEFHRRAGATEAYNISNNGNGALKQLDIVEFNESDIKQTEKNISDFLKAASFPLGIHCGADDAACLAVKTALSMGISIPDELGIITEGVTDMPLHIHPEITALRSDQSNISFAANRMLIQLLDRHPLKERHVMIPFDAPYIIPRGTTLNRKECHKEEELCLQ